ncbi:flavin-containing monooxygenase 5-like [Haliotis cracherodii]|uniref:flavin-containing monooxygenase 5-like n=1 Tax=Haliotis cracherodii TaxID=6455 RepID=UPI0039EB9CCB
MAARKRVAIVGAGLAGLAAIKSCLEEGLEPVCFEQYDKFGGVWYYTEEYREGQGARAFEYLTTNVSREMFGFSDFPYPPYLPPFMTRTMVYDYILSYCETFGLGKYIHLNTRVNNIKKSRDYNVTGRWEVETMDSEKKTQRDIFDFVMICSGFYKKPRTPDIKGLDTFKGSTEHSMRFKDALQYKDKSVLIVGNSHSSGDTAAACSAYARQVYYCVGDGMYMLPLCVKNGQPWDLAIFKRSNYWNPDTIFELEKALSNERLDHRRAGLAPSTPPSRTRIMLSDRVQYIIMSGRIKVVNRLVRLGPHEAEFDDGTVIKNLDAVLFATGYDFFIDFIDEPLQGADGKLSLYKMMFPLHQQHTLSVIGCVDSDGPIPPLAELQGRLAARVYAGNHRLPSLKVMADVVEEMNSSLFERFGRYKYLIPNLVFRDAVAEELGVTPSLWDLIKAGPRLAYLYYYGPALPYHYRLWGPHTWSGAKKAINYAVEHGHYAKQMRNVQPPDVAGANYFFRIIIVSTVVVLLALAYQRGTFFG